MEWNHEELAGKIQAMMEPGLRPAAFGDQLELRFLGWNESRSALCFLADTFPWMCNIDGAIHGGVCATMADQAMGLVVCGLKAPDTIAPTLQLQITYHRPLLPGQQVLIQVQIVSTSAKLIHLEVRASLPDRQDRPCFSSSATFYCKKRPA